MRDRARPPRRRREQRKLPRHHLMPAQLGIRASRSDSHFLRRNLNPTHLGEFPNTTHPPTPPPPRGDSKYPPPAAPPGFPRHTAPSHPCLRQSATTYPARPPATSLPP